MIDGQSPGVPWRRRANGLELRVRLTPRGGRDTVDGIDILSDGSVVLKLRVRAAPQDGEANEAARKVLAKALRMATSSITLEAGATSRVKTLLIAGNPVALEAALTEICKI